MAASEPWLPPSAVLDTCVLVPAALRDTFLRCSEVGLYRVRWTDEILRELGRALTGDVGIGQTKVDKLIRTMRGQFPHALIQDYTTLIDAMQNHRKDRHVLAAAVTAAADIIVTFNLRHFPRRLTASLGVEAQSPDVFLSRLLHHASPAMVSVLTTQAHELRQPSKSPLELVKTLSRYVPTFALYAEELFTHTSESVASPSSDQVHDQGRD